MCSRRGWAGWFLAAVLLAVAVFSAPAQGRDRGPTIARSASAPVSDARTFRAPPGVTHLAVHWQRARAARVRVALSRDGRHFGRARAVELDDVFEARPGRETYGAIIVAHRVRAVRVFTDRPLRRLTVLWLDDSGRPVRSLARKASVGYPQPKVVPRVDWGANESYRFDSSGQEIWPSAFYPVQKLIAHHTATRNNDPDPAATIRSIYYYHAVTQGWGDIGYNFLIDEAGNVYEGRHTFDHASGSSPTEENSLGEGVTAAHAQGYNSGTVGIAILGTLTNQDATPAARSALERLLAWESDHHGIDPQGSSLYTNPVSGTQATFPNIAGHRDVAATECPGGVFYATLPTIRSEVAAMLGATAPAPAFSLSATPATQSVVRGRAATYTVTVSPENGFTGSVSLSATGVPSGAAAMFSPNPATTSSGLTVQTSRSTPPGGYTLTVTGANGSLSRSTTVGLRVKRK
jgi:N-acetylmuramoyl-L-alanine amidase